MASDIVAFVSLTALLCGWIGRVYWLLNSERPYRLSFRAFFLIWYGIAYAVTPAAYLFFERIYGLSSLHPWFEPWVRNICWAEYAALVLVGYTAYELGFGLFRRGKGTPRQMPVCSVLENLENSWRAGWSLVLLGCIGYAFFIAVYGLDIALTTNIRYESHGIEASRTGAFFLYTRVWIFLGFLIVLVRYLHLQQPRLVDRIGVVIPFVLAVYTSVQGASRAYFLYLVILPFISYLLIRRRLPITGTVVVVALLPLLIVFGRTILAYSLLADPALAFTRLLEAVGQVEFAAVASLFVSAFTHPFASLPVAVDAVEKTEFRLFSDVPLAGLFYLRVLGIDFGYTVTYIHTYQLSAEYRSNIPPGVLAAGYYQLGVAGVAIFLAFIGAVSRLLQDALAEAATANKAYLAPYVYLAFVLGNFVMNGDPRVYFINLNLILFGVAVIWAFTKRNTFR